MLRYFIRNRHGVISVMLAIVLTAVLSMGSTLMEIARYRSLERLYKEIAENAAFSILAHYDRDLYEYFGLLGIQQDVGDEELRQYLGQNLMGIGSGMSLNGADLLSSGISEVELEKLYDLTQNDVFRSQIAEFAAYRAPISIINNNLDIEASLQELSDKLAEALPMLELFQQVSGAAEACLDTIINVQHYVISLTECQSAIKEYTEKVKSYNAAISDLNRYKDEEDDSEEGYADGLEECLNAVAENAADLQKKIDELIKALEDLEEKQNAFIESYETMVGANLKALFGAGGIGGFPNSAIGNGFAGLVDKMEEGYEEGEQKLTDLYRELQQGLSDFQFQNVKDKLEAQSNQVSGLPQDLLQIDPVWEVYESASPIWPIIKTVIDIGGELIDLITSGDDLIEAITQIKKCAEFISMTNEEGVIDDSMDYGVIEPPYSSLRNVENPFETEDALRVDRQIQETTRIAESVDFNALLLQTGETWEMTALSTAMQEMKTAEENFREACQRLTTSGDLIGILRSIKDMVGSVKSYLSNLIKLVQIFITQVTGNLGQLVYQRIYASVYATEMFSNRVTDKENETRLNGSSFFSATDLAEPSRCFVQADAEYIFWGSESEESNQAAVFWCMLAMRVLGNIPAILTDSAFIEVLSSVAGIPFVGWILDVLLVLTRIYVEAWADMIFMIYGREEVDIVKMKGYFDFSGEGLDELEAKMQALLEEQTGYSMEGFSITDRSDKSGSSGTSGRSGNLGDSNKSDDSDGNSGFMQGYVDGLLEWGYKDHLFVLMLFFKSSDDIYVRSANLIELELQQKKAKDGAPRGFKLNEMATYIRVETEAEYTPLLPVPVIPGLNSSGFKIDTMHYSGY